MIRFLKGETYVAEKAFHGTTRNGNPFSKVVIHEQVRSKDRLTVIMWIEGAPDINPGDSFKIESINSFSYGKMKDKDGKWTDSHEATFNINATVIPAAATEWTDEDGGNPFAEDDDGELPY